MSNEDNTEVVKQNVQAIEVRVRRDANTISHVRVMPYEMVILAKLYGKENVVKVKDAGTHPLEIENEYQRLCSKYGAEVVVAVYGDDEGLRLSEHVEKHIVKAEKPKKADKGQAAGAAAGGDAGNKPE